MHFVCILRIVLTACCKENLRKKWWIGTLCSLFAYCIWCILHAVSNDWGKSGWGILYMVHNAGWGKWHQIDIRLVHNACSKQNLRKKVLGTLWSLFAYCMVHGTLCNLFASCIWCTLHAVHTCHELRSRFLKYPLESSIVCCPNGHSDTG